MKLPASFAYCFSTGTHLGKASVEETWGVGRKLGDVLGIERMREFR